MRSFRRRFSTRAGSCIPARTSTRVTVSRRMNVHTPTYMRAPGEASGIFALESRHGRACGGAQFRSGRAAPAQRAGAGRVQEVAVLEPLYAGMLSGSCRALRLEPAQPRAALDARRPLAHRLGHGDRHLPDELRTGHGDGAAPARRHRRSDERIERHGPGHLDVHDAGGSRGTRPADRTGEVHARRHAASEGAHSWGLDDHGERRQCRAGGLPQGARGRHRPRRRQ